ncbi:MAG: TadE/TadG family type IV pilus assembly protein [Solirubrobacterales bacterium]
MSRRTGSAHGQASVEFVAVLPALLLCALVAAQLGLAGHALWSAGVAARAGARAEHVGGDGAAAARRSLPGLLRDGARVSSGPPVRVRVKVPSLIPGLPRFDVDAATSLEPDAR